MNAPSRLPRQVSSALGFAATATAIVLGWAILRDAAVPAVAESALPAAASTAPPQTTSTADAAVKSSTVAKPSTEPPGQPRSAAPDELTALADRVQEFGFSRPDIYASVELNAASKRIVVYRKPDATFDAELAELSDVTGVLEVRDAPYALNDLRHLRTEVLAFAERSGVDVVGTESSYDGRVLVVRVSSDLVTARRVLQEKFGAAVDVDPGEEGSLL